MIKVNLLKDKTDQAHTGAIENTSHRGYKDILSIGDNFAEPEVGPAIKLLIIVIPVALFYFYEMKIKKDAQVKVSRITEEVQRTQTIRDEKKTIVDALSLLKTEYDYRKPILDEFKKISYEKLHGIKILDQLQDLLPTQIWVTSVDLDRTRIDVAGYSVSDKALTVFQKNFEDSAYFRNILIYNSIEEKTQNGDSVTSFKMKANFNAEARRGG